MNSSTSFTRQETMLNCPRRFYHRYLDSSPRAKALRQLYSVRELGGHCIHRSLADAVKRISCGDRISDQVDIVQAALELFDLVVHRSTKLRPGVFAGGMQLAETYNGSPCQESIRDWRDLVPLAVNNGIRLMHYFGLGPSNQYYTLEAEQEVIWTRNGRTRRFVIDVLIEDKSRGISVIDWKTRTYSSHLAHSITETDLKQLSLYQEWLLDSGRALPTRIYGFAVDLLREQIVEHHYRKIDQLHVPRGSSRRSELSGLARPSDSTNADHFPAKGSPTTCSICPFATLCPHSALPQMEFHYGM